MQILKTCTGSVILPARAFGAFLQLQVRCFKCLYIQRHLLYAFHDHVVMCVQSSCLAYHDCRIIVHVCSWCHALDLQTEGKHVVFVAYLRASMGETADITSMPYSPRLQICQSVIRSCLLHHPSSCFSGCFFQAHFSRMQADLAPSKLSQTLLLLAESCLQRSSRSSVKPFTSLYCITAHPGIA